mgnify:CR=1 FL=1
MLRPAAILVLTPLIAGCSAPSSSTTTTDRSAQPLAVTDFAAARAVAPRTTPDTQRDDNAPVLVNQGPLTARVGAPTLPGSPGGEQGERVVIDRVVGQINGKPIYAEAFYRDSARRWIEESKTLSAREWSTNIQAFTERELYRQVREELLLAEFRSRLTEPQRQGVLAFVEGLRAETVREFGGSEQRANQQFLRDQGITLDDAIRNRAEREFIFQQLRNTISRRVQVSSRDIELYYNRNLDTYPPAPVATIRQAFSSAANEARVAELAEAFASPDPLPEGLGVTTTVTLDRAGPQATRFYAPDELNDAARSLTEGDSAGPIALGDNVWFLRLESVDRPEQRSLYDAQLEIEETIRQERLVEEEAVYFERLLARSNVSTINTMIARLLEYAIERLYQPGTPPEEG